MIEVLIHSTNGAKVAFQGKEDGAYIQLVELVLTDVASSATAGYLLKSLVQVPQAAIESLGGTNRFKSISQLPGDAGTVADYRAALHFLAELGLAHSGSFLGAQIESSSRLWLELNIEAVLEGNDAAASLRGRIRLEMVNRIDVGTLKVGGSTGSSASINLAWQLDLRFGEKFEVELASPTLQFALPAWELTGLSLPGWKWKSSKPPTWRWPAWLSSLSESVSLEVIPERLEAEIDAAGVIQITADSIEVRYDSKTVLSAATWVLRSSGGSTAGAITFATLDLGRLTARDVLGLPVDGEIDRIQATPVLESGALKLVVNLAEVRLTEHSGSSVVFSPIEFTVRSTGLGDFKATLVDGAISTTLMLSVTDFVAGAAGTVASLVEWTLGFGAGAAGALAKLLDFLRHLALPRPQLPTVGPLRDAYSALLQLLRQAPAELSVQLVFDRSTHRLSRTVVSARNALSGNPLDIGFGGAAFHVAVKASTSARLALVIEHQGPTAGDWFLAAVPAPNDDGKWFESTVSSDLWLDTGETTQLTQDTGENGAPPNSPLVSVTVRARERYAIALFGMRSSRPLWFQRFPADGLEIVKANQVEPKVRLTLAEGAYRLVPIASDALDVSFNWDATKAKRLLPFLRDPGSESGVATGLTQFVRFDQRRHISIKA